MDTFKTYVNQVSDFIGGAVAGLFMTLAVAAFLYTVVRFIMARAKGGDGNAIKDARNQLGWSIVGLFVIFSIWGIIAFLQTALPSGNRTTITPPSVSVTGGSGGSFESGSAGSPSAKKGPGETCQDGSECLSGMCFPGQGSQNSQNKTCR